MPGSLHYCRLSVTAVRNRQDRSNFVLPPGLDYPNLKEAGKHKTAEGLVPYAIIALGKMSSGSVPFSNGPILLKGILDPDHVEKAVKSGASGIIVSNHGGRNLDTVPATIDALPRVTDRVEGRVPVLMDGGIRSGTDYSKPWPTARARSLSVVRICMASPSREMPASLALSELSKTNL